MKLRQIKVSVKQFTAIKLLFSIKHLDKKFFDKEKGSYKVSIGKSTGPIKELITVGNMNNNIKFEIRQTEPQHNEAHFHVTIRGKGCGAYRLTDFTPIHSNLRKPDEAIILEWANENRQVLIDTWNRFHGYRIMVA